MGDMADMLEQQGGMEEAVAFGEYPDNIKGHTMPNDRVEIADGIVTTEMLAPAPALSWTREQINLIKSTVAKGTTDDEFALFLYVCRRTGLDPLARQIYAIKRWNSSEERMTMTIQTGIDGYRLIAARTEQHAGTDDTVFEGEDEEHPRKATTTVYRWVQGQRVPFTASARWDEYVQTDKEGFANAFWRRMPFGQLGKCSEALALRKGWPADLSGVYTNDEMMQADNLTPARREQQIPHQSVSQRVVVQSAAGEPPTPITDGLITKGQHEVLLLLQKKNKVSDQYLSQYLSKPPYRIADPKDLKQKDLNAVLAWLQTATMKEPDLKEIAKGKPISVPQQKRLFAICNEHDVAHTDFKIWLEEEKSFTSSKDITTDKYDEICHAIETGIVASWIAATQEIPTEWEPGTNG